MPENTPPAVSRETIAGMARLAGLELTDEQVQKIVRDFESLMKTAATLSEIDLGETEPAFVFRADRPLPPVPLPKREGR